MDSSSRKRQKARPQTAIKAAKFADGVMAGKSQRQAALDAGFSQAAADKPAERVVPWVPGSLKAAIRAAIKPRDIARVLTEGMNATEVKVGFHEGVAIESEPYVDHKERRQHAELAAKLGGMIEAEDRDSNDIKVEITVL